MNKKLINVNCNLCGSNDFKVFYEEGKAQIHRIVKCRKCGLMYANPQKDNVSNVEKVYLKSNSDIFENNLEINRFNPEYNQYLKKQFLQLEDYRKIIDFLGKEKKGTLLEIGSFAGVFLNEAKRSGWNVIGVEPLEIPALYAEKEFGIRVIKKYFDKVNIEENSIDAIVSCHVIEHVSDPSSFVKKAYSILSERGKLILETPTYDSFLFWLLKYRERSIRCNGHLYFFTKKTLEELLRKCGFIILKHEKVGRTLSIDRLIYNVGVIVGKKNLFSKISQKLRLDKIVIKLNMRDMQRIYCIKK